MENWSFTRQLIDEAELFFLLIAYQVFMLQIETGGPLPFLFPFPVRFEHEQLVIGNGNFFFYFFL